MLHHVMHRGAARRTVFESRRDMRFFLAQLAKASRRGWIEVLCFVLLHTHFHLFLRSTIGELSMVMRRILNPYVRYFNRRRRRDGSLFRGRFLSKPVLSIAHSRAVVRYIDDNPVAAGLAAVPSEYAWGSAGCYAERSGPIWLGRGWIEDSVQQATSATEYDPRDYPVCFPPKLSAAVRNWVRDSLRKPNSADRELDDLLAASPAGVRAWMERKSLLADGTGHGKRIVAPELVECALSEFLLRFPGWDVQRSARRNATGAGDLALPGLLEGIAGLSLREIAVRTGLPKTTVQDRIGAHRQAARSDERYRDRCALIAADALGSMADLIAGR